MDRLMVYPGAIPLDTDVLSVERNVMQAIGWLTQATFATASGVTGLPCNPTAPASMTVNIGPGAIWAQAEIDQSPFGSLPADASPLMKMGILPEAAGTNFTLTAPSVSGQSINYLIEAAFIESDEDPVVLPYVNPSNPAQPFTGPDNSGTPQNTVRAQRVDLQLKAGVAANTGTQVTPSVDTGYVGLYVITVNFGQTTITSANIARYENAPFNGGPFAPQAGNAAQAFSVGPATQATQAPQVGQMQSGSMLYAVDTSATANQIVIALNPAPASLVDGQTVRFKAANSNTGATTIAVNELSGITLNTAAGALQGGEIVAGSLYEVCYNAATNTAVIVGSGGGALAGAPATQGNQYTTLGQFPYSQSSGYIWPQNSATPNQFVLLGLPGAGESSPLYMQIGAGTIENSGQYYPFAFPFPNECLYVIGGDVGDGLFTYAFWPASRFGMNVYKVQQSQGYFQYIAFGR